MPSPFPWNDVFPIILLTGQLSHPGPVRSTSPVISLVGGFGEQLPASGTRATPKAQGTSCCECLPCSSAHPLHRSPEVRSTKYRLLGGFPSTISAAKLVYGHEARPELSSPSSPISPPSSRPLVRPLPRQGLSYPSLSHPSPLQKLREMGVKEVFVLARPAANTDVTLHGRSRRRCFSG
jgi:hypothetical protein